MSLQELYTLDDTRNAIYTFDIYFFS